jgi:hypothetical protein
VRSLARATRAVQQLSATLRVSPTARALLAGIAALGWSLALPAASAAAVPKVHLEVRGKIGDGRKVSGRMTVRAPRGAYRGRMGIELRGASSMAFAKKSYSLETRGRGTAARSFPLLGMPSESDWVLNASHRDRTFMRDALAYATARRLGRWAPRTRHAEVFLNGRHQGLYLVTERIKLDRSRVAVPREGITGGYVLELAHGLKGAAFVGPVTQMPYGHHHPRAKRLTVAERAWVADHLGAAERALYQHEAPWRTIIDEDAAVDYVLLQELFRNQDAFRRSTFLTKGSDRPLALGPVWDFDRSMGNSNPEHLAPEGWVGPGRPWADPLLADPGFVDRLVARWREVRAGGLLPFMMGRIERDARLLRPASVRNARRWPSTRRPTHAAEVRRLRRWLSTRVAWIDRHVEELRPAGGDPR